MAQDTDENQEPQPGTPEYEDKMAELGKTAVDPDGNADEESEQNTDQDSDKSQEEDKPEKPADVPEKFWDAEKGEVDYAAWAKSTQELERKLSQGNESEDDDKSKDDDDKSDDKDKSKENGDDDDKLPEGAQLSPEDFQTYSQEFAENGELSEDTYEALEKSGIPRDYVDAYIDGQQAKSEMFQQRMLSESGLNTRENFEHVSEWAQANMAEKDLKAYNEAIDSNDPKAISQALTNMREAFEDAKGSVSSNLLDGEGQGGADVFESSSQVVNAMSDPRYKSDPAYRKEVEDKLARSPNAFK